LTAQTLRTVITDTKLPLGSSEAGQVWATKALHPSDAVTVMDGIPDAKSRPSAFLAFNNMFQVSAPGAITSSQTWDLDLLLTPDPICFGSNTSDITGDYVGSLIAPVRFAPGLANKWFLNPQIIGQGNSPELSYVAKAQSWYNSVRHYRLGYYGATIQLDAPAVANQGTIVATQYPVVTQTFTMAKYDLGGSLESTSKKREDNIAAPVCQACRSIQMVPYFRAPTFTSIQNLPDVFTGKAVDGTYVPFKLSEEDLRFRNADDASLVHSDYDASTAENVLLTAAAVNLRAADVDVMLAPVQGVVIPLDNTALPSAGIMMPRCTENIGHVCMRGLSPSATVYVYVRCGFEIIVPPGSTYSPYVHQPLVHDPLALDAYFGIARQLKDAYPASYNDLGTMLETIGSIAERVLPMIVPGISPMLSMVKGAYRGFKTIAGKSDSAPNARAAGERVIKSLENTAPAVPSRVGRKSLRQRPAGRSEQPITGETILVAKKRAARRRRPARRV